VEQGEIPAQAFEHLYLCRGTTSRGRLEHQFNTASTIAVFVLFAEQSSESNTAAMFWEHVPQYVAGNVSENY
jgi:hypothetical protein